MQALLKFSKAVDGLNTQIGKYVIWLILASTVISAVNAYGQFWAATYTGKLDADSFVQFLKDFRKSQGGTVFMVLDGLAIHKAKTVMRYVESLKGRLELTLVAALLSRPESRRICLGSYEEQRGFQKATQAE